MSDILCPRCTEPWDIDSLHDAVVEGRYPTFDEAYRTFRTSGCGHVFGTRPCTDRSVVGLHELAELLGDDIDSYAAECMDIGPLHNDDEPLHDVGGEDGAQ